MCRYDSLTEERPVTHYRSHPLGLSNFYPEPHNAPDVSPGMNVPNLPEGKRPKATDLCPWYRVCHFTNHINNDP